MCKWLNIKSKGGINVGYKLREAREAKRLTQEELAQKSGISRQTIISIETVDGYNTTFNTLVKLADALGMTVDQIFFADSVQ